jgi:phage tail sheath protein FI
VARSETTDNEVTRRGSVADVVDNMRDRGINSSYGCSYFPWVRIKDAVNDADLWVPPSIVALGTFASSERKSEVWFAPAGFNRGGLTEGSAGLPVLGVRERLTSADRDELYLQNINPIASFPSEGIVIFGQKTLQMQRSALDRINVRRLMIFLKKEVSRLATRVLFDQNVEATWNRFKALVDPFLASVRARFGITEYRLILDESTTTPDLIDQNVLYAKILLKPARAIEFIAIDFVIANTGASFDD